MSRRFDKSLLLCPDRNSLFGSLQEILKELSNDVRGYDISDKISTADSFIQAQSLRMPYRWRSGWERHFQGKLNRDLLEFIKSYQPELVLVYNSEFLLPETCAEIKRRSLLLFYLADSPFYTPQNNYYLTVLSYADLILSPDSFWSRQLNTIGLLNTLYFVPGPDYGHFNRLSDITDFSDAPGTEILYVGSSYYNSWGYKKALLMSKFVNFDFHLHGNTMWKRWFRFFPELESKYYETGFIPSEKLNRMFNMTKLIPVDGNPGILNGFHLRVFEALCAGALPLTEDREDVEAKVFKGCDAKVPLIKDYNKAEDIARYYLQNETERKETVEALILFIRNRYNKAANAGLLSEAIERIK
jgi:hypothetical protein